MSKGNINLYKRTLGYSKALIAALKAKKEKITVKNVIAIAKDRNGKIIWLEKGYSKDNTDGKKPSGLKHILEEHEKDFINQNLIKEEIPNYLMTAITYGVIIKSIGKRNPRPVYEFYYENKLRRVAITIGSNGYIVGANPISIKGGKNE